MPFVVACGCVEHDHMSVPIPVGDVQLISGRINDHVCRPSELVACIAPATLPTGPDLEEKPSGPVKFQNLIVAHAVAGDPDAARGIHVDPMLGARPFITVARTAPSLKQIAFRVEFQNRGRGNAALEHGRVERGASLIVGKRTRTVNDPDVTFIVGCDARRLTEDPVVR